ncbi:MAG: hypothetical protein RMK29_19015 [Myxococcales bacterium]|nr:hypothetical protein [Myxococcota bacterium]MDW8283798.1 hypothetical protein [Myxococcales bacterium]
MSNMVSQPRDQRAVQPRGRAGAQGLLLALSLLSLSCARQQVATPTRALDRPSDVALFCVDFEFQIDFDGDGRPDDCPGALPARGPDDTDASYQRRVLLYLTRVCEGAAPVDTTVVRASLLPDEECDGPHRQRRSEALLAPVREAARILGLDPESPCCPVGNPGCGVAPSLCSRRKLEALVTNTSRGELAVVDTQAQVPGLNTFGQIQNLHSGKPGFGFLPVGRLPLHVRTSAPRTQVDQSGRGLSPQAWAVTTNAGSCDLSVIDLQPVAQLLALPAECDETSCPRRVVPHVRSPDRPLGARPVWAEVAPWADRRALVAFPGCGLVAEVDLRTGRLVEGLAFDPQGKARRLPAEELAALRCPADCGGGDAALASLPGQLGEGTTAGKPVTLAVDREGSRLIIGDAASQALTIVPFSTLAADGQRLGMPRQIALDYSPLADSPAQRGVEVVRLSPRTAAGRFLYAVARDGTVRVVDLDSETECETNPDPRYLQALAAAGPGRVLPDEMQDQNLRRFACLPVGVTPRSPLSTSPGISVPGGGLARDVAFVRLDLPCDPALQSCPFFPETPPADWLPASPGVWIGDFAWILGSNGIVQAVQVADYCPDPSFRACFPDQAVARRAVLLMTRSIGNPTPELLDLPSLPQAAWVTPADRLGNSRRPLVSRFNERDPGPRVETGRPSDPQFAVRGPPGANSATAPDPQPGAPARLVLPAPAEYPYLPTDPVCGLVLRDALANVNLRPRTIAAFPDPLAVRNETWVLEWEGIIPGTARSNGLLLPDGSLLDLGALYCNRGVENGDRVWLSSCLRNEDCLGGVCVREQAQGSAGGICLPTLRDGARCRAESQRLTTDRPAAGADSLVWAATWLRRYRILKIEQQKPQNYPLITAWCDEQRACPGGLRCVGGACLCDAQHPCPGGLQCVGGTCQASDTADRLILGELAQPESSAEQRRCDNLAYGEPCPDEAAISVQLSSTPSCDEQTPCPHGWRCDLVRRRCDVPAGEQLRPVGRRTTCRADVDDRGVPIKRCVLECNTSQDCGAGFVCAHSIYEWAEGGLGRLRPRCLRAPLIAEGAPIMDGGTVRPMSRADAERVLRACFPDPLSYQVRAGDAFLVRGLVSSAPVLQRVAADGSCERPGPGDPAYQAGRLRQPRLRLGPRESLQAGDPRLCPPPEQWIPHRLPPPERTQSCRRALEEGRVRLPSGVELRVARQEEAEADPSVRQEYELLSSLPLDHPGVCVLSDAGTEAPDATRCPDGSRPPCPRRIHYENAVLNLVLRLPRRPDPLVLEDARGRVVLPAREWAVPPEGYSIVFNVLGGFRPFAVTAEVPAGQRAQSLRAAITAPDGAVFIVDEGRLGAAAGLRGQLMRIFRTGMDNSFLVR